MSFYVKRERADRPTGWTGPIRSEAQAYREAHAWTAAGNWTATVVKSTPEVRKQIREWERDKRDTQLKRLGLA